MDGTVPATRRELGTIVLVHLLLKAAILAVAYHTIGDIGGRSFPGALHAWAIQWDGIHYLNLAEHGYVRDTIPDLGDPFAFPPMYPMLVAQAGGAWWSLLLVSNIMAVVACVLMGLWMGYRAGLFFAAFPLWVVYSLVGYTESTALAFGIGAMLLLDRARVFPGATGHALAGLAAAGSALTRYVLGLGLVAAFLVRTWTDRRDPRGRLAAVAAGPVLVAGIGVAMWMHTVGGSWTAYFRSQEAWGAALRGPIAQVDFLLHGFFTNQPAVTEEPIEFVLRNLVFTAPVVFGAVVLALRRAWPELALSAVMLAIVFSTVGTPAVSVPRLALAAFPAVAAPGLLMGRQGTIGYMLVAAPLGAWMFIMHQTSFFA